MKKINKSPSVRDRAHTSVKREENEQIINHKKYQVVSYRALMKRKPIRKATGLLCRDIKWSEKPC